MQVKGHPLPTFLRLLKWKICTIRDKFNTARTGSPPIVERHFSGQPFSSFHPVSGTVRNVTVKSARKTCELEHVPTALLCDCLDALLPYITHVINESLVSGIFRNDL